MASFLFGKFASILKTLWLMELLLGGEVNPKFFGLAAQNLLTGIKNEEPSKKLELFDGNPPVHGV